MNLNEARDIFKEIMKGHVDFINTCEFDIDGLEIEIIEAYNLLDKSNYFTLDLENEMVKILLKYRYSTEEQIRDMEKIIDYFIKEIRKLKGLK